MKRFAAIGIVIAAAILCSCSNKQEPTTSVVPPPATASAAAPMPDVGKVDTVVTKADGYGATPAVATSEAMKQAILQVNGTSIDTGSVEVKYGLNVTDGKDALTLKGNEFAEMVAQKSGGAITNFKVLNVMEPKEKGGQYQVTIEANIAHFTTPAENKKIKVVVAPIRFDTAGFVVGSDTFPAQKVADDIRQQISVALANTGRFSVLDREIGSDVQQELDLVTSGQAPRAEAGKLGQAGSADVIWAGHISSLAYNRHARKLMTSDRELVSYSGGWAVSQKLVNVATREVLTSDSLQGTAPEVPPTTMSKGIDASQVLQGIETTIASDVVASILARTFPITVVSRNGTTVVLSQGGQAVKAGLRYTMVTMGSEVKDPQTGNSLGRTESPCCEVVIDNVAPNLSYGHLENVKIALDKVLPGGGLQIRGQVRTADTSPEKEEPETGVASKALNAGSKAMSVKQLTGQTDPAEKVPLAGNKEDSKW